ncbi:hypothetical protein BDW22DRAFT_849865 [Trametopsis cervina]|nr:hypothetical protein BDW22DRAFT_849865 [Trametopsis cervina]
MVYLLVVEYRWVQGPRFVYIIVIIPFHTSLLPQASQPAKPPSAPTWRNAKVPNGVLNTPHVYCLLSQFSLSISLLSMSSRPPRFSLHPVSRRRRHAICILSVPVSPPRLSTRVRPSDVRSPSRQSRLNTSRLVSCLSSHTRRAPFPILTPIPVIFLFVILLLSLRAGQVVRPSPTPLDVLFESNVIPTYLRICAPATVNAFLKCM